MSADSSGGAGSISELPLNQPVHSYAPAPAPAAKKEFSRAVLLWIAIYKLLKAAIMLAAGVATRHLLHRDLTKMVLHFARSLNLDPQGKFVFWLLARVLKMDDHRLKLLGAGFFIYAVLYAIEGVGLYYEQRWAEWLTIVTTCLLIPLEGYELFRHPTGTKAVIVVLNLAMVAYLVWRLTRDRHRLELLAGRSKPVPDPPRPTPDGAD